MSEISADAPKPRLCHIIKWPDFDGYGFNLHADKTRPGQYIGKVDENSPADVAGLKEGDRIIEVNGVNILNENHKQVVQRIKNIPNETKLLVVDSEADRWYKEKDIVVRGDQANIHYGTSVKSSSKEPLATNGEVKKIDDDSHSTNSAHSSQSERSSSQPPLPTPNCPSVLTQREGNPLHEENLAPAFDSKIPEISVSITDYDNIIFAHENEIGDDDTQNDDDKSKDSDEIKGSEHVENKIEELKISVPDDYDDSKGGNDDKSVKSENYDPSIKSENDDPSIKSENDDPSIKSENDDQSIKSDKVDAAMNKLDKDDDSAKSIKDDESNNDNNSEKGVETSEVSTVDNERKDEVLESDSRSSSLEMDSSTSTKYLEEPSLEAPIPKVEEAEKNDLQDVKKSSISSTPSSPPPPVEKVAPVRKPETQAESSSKTKTSMKNGGLNLNMTAAEMRAQLAAKKKFDPRKDTIDLKKKYQIIQNM